MSLSDKDLLYLICNKKDGDAFKVFYDRYATLLYTWANKRTGQKELSDDIVQNFWILFWTKPTIIKVDDNGSARAYLMRYFYFKMYDYLQASATKLLGDSKLFDTLKESAHYTTIFEELGVQEILEVIDRIVNELPQTYREIFQFIWEEEHSVKEAGKQFNLSEKVIRTRYSKVITKVQSKITELHSEPITSESLQIIVYCALCVEQFSN